MGGRFSIRKLFLNLLVIVCLVVAGWMGYQLFISHELNPVFGSIVLIVDIGVLIWNLAVLRSNYYRRMFPSFKVVFLPLFAVVLILAFAGVQPLVEYKDNIIDEISSCTNQIDTIVTPIATIESKYVIWRLGSGIYVNFSFVPKTANPNVEYNIEFYVRGKLRETKLLRFSEKEINTGMVKEVEFNVFESDIVRKNDIVDMSIFDAKIVEYQND